MGFFSALFGGTGKKYGKPKTSGKRKPSKAEAMKAWGAKAQPGKGGYVPKGKR